MTHIRQLQGRNAAVIGGSRGLGRVIVEALHAEGAHVLAVAREQKPLQEVAQHGAGIRTLALDATDESAPAAVFAAFNVDILILCAGSIPPTRSLQEQTWQEFSANWDTDVKASFLFCKAALALPLKRGALVVLISSGAAIGGSPISGGYAGAKRMQMFMASYCQKESDRLQLGLRFIAIAPRIMPDTGVGTAAIAGYSTYLRISSEQFLQSINSRHTPGDVAQAIIELATSAGARPGTAFSISGAGLEALT